MEKMTSDSTGYAQTLFVSSEYDVITWTKQTLAYNVTKDFIDAVTNGTIQTADVTEEQDQYYELYYLQIYPFENDFLGIVRPFLIALTFFANVFVVGFFLTVKNRWRGTNLLFVSISFSDTMTSLTLFPNSIYVYAGARYYLTREWCNIYMILRFYLFMVFHTVSVWQTVLLGIQRYLCISHPFSTRRICTFRKTFVCILIMYCLAIILHMYHLVDNKIGIARCRWVIEDPCARSCVYLWFSVVLQHLAPCIILLILTIITIMELRKARESATLMLRKMYDGKRATRDRIITITVTLIVVCFLIPELPYGCYYLTLLFYKHFKKEVFGTFENHVVQSVYEIILIVNFHANFWIYCAMMNDFRQAFLRLLTCGMVKADNALQPRSFSMTSRKNSVATSVSSSTSLSSRYKVFNRTTFPDRDRSFFIPMSVSRSVSDDNDSSKMAALKCRKSIQSMASHITIYSDGVDIIDDVNEDVFV